MSIAIIGGLLLIIPTAFVTLIPSHLKITDKVDHKPTIRPKE